MSRYISQQMGFRLLPKIGFSCNTGSTYPLKLLNSNTLSYSWVFTKASLLFWPVSESCSWPWRCQCQGLRPSKWASDCCQRFVLDQEFKLAVRASQLVKLHGWGSLGQQLSKFKVTEKKHSGACVRICCAHSGQLENIAEKINKLNKKHRNIWNQTKKNNTRSLHLLRTLPTR
jgi:hypothetical protein